MLRLRDIMGLRGLGPGLAGPPRERFPLSTTALGAHCRVRCRILLPIVPSAFALSTCCYDVPQAQRQSASRAHVTAATGSRGARPVSYPLDDAWINFNSSPTYSLAPCTLPDTCSPGQWQLPTRFGGAVHGEVPLFGSALAEHGH